MASGYIQETLDSSGIVGKGPRKTSDVRENRGSLEDIIDISPFKVPIRKRVADYAPSLAYAYDYIIEPEGRISQYFGGNGRRISILGSWPDTDQLSGNSTASVAMGLIHCNKYNAEYRKERKQLERKVQIWVPPKYSWGYTDKEIMKKVLNDRLVFLTDETYDPRIIEKAMKEEGLISENGGTFKGETLMVTLDHHGTNTPLIIDSYKLSQRFPENFIYVNSAFESEFKEGGRNGPRKIDERLYEQSLCGASLGFLLNREVLEFHDAVGEKHPKLCEFDNWDSLTIPAVLGCYGDNRVNEWGSKEFYEFFQKEIIDRFGKIPEKTRNGWDGPAIMKWKIESAIQWDPRGAPELITKHITDRAMDQSFSDFFLSPRGREISKRFDSWQHYQPMRFPDIMKEKQTNTLSKYVWDNFSKVLQVGGLYINSIYIPCGEIIKPKWSTVGSSYEFFSGEKMTTERFQLAHRTLANILARKEKPNKHGIIGVASIDVGSHINMSMRNWGVVDTIGPTCRQISVLLNPYDEYPKGGGHDAAGGAPIDKKVMWDFDLKGRHIGNLVGILLSDNELGKLVDEVSSEQERIHAFDRVSDVWKTKQVREVNIPIEK